MKQALREAGVIVDGIAEATVETGTALIMVDAAGQNQIAVCEGANAAVGLDEVTFADDETVLQENMTFHAIAGMWMTGYGFEVSESFRVSSNGVEIFTDAPRELILRGN